MDVSNKTVLVTGGASGIGLAIAERFANAGSTVILCGRRREKLEEAKSSNPKFQLKVCDISLEKERKELLAWVNQNHPSLNVLINNAGIQRRVNLLEAEPWEKTREEIAINLEAPIHLCQLFIPHLLKQKDPSIVNVTSGLSFAPLANVPVYCSTKAALHSFTLSLRYQLAKTPIQVVEVIPPAVNTDLGGPGLHTFGVPLNEFADSIFERMRKGDLEIGFGTAEYVSQASRKDLDIVFQRMNPPANA
jgi:uncharacterized oxidoreductase